MQIVPLASLPSQSFNIQFDNNDYAIRLFLSNGVMAIDLAINNVVILTGQRVVVNYPIIPYRYLENGNFFFSSNNEDLIDYQQFGTNQLLIYISQAELAALRAGV